VNGPSGGAGVGDETAEADAVRRMLEPGRIAVVGASARPGSFGHRLVTEVSRSPVAIELHLVNPHYDEVAGRPCVASLDDIDGPVDLVLLGIPDAAVEQELSRAARRGDRAAVVYGSLFETGPPASTPLRNRLADLARSAGMALCGGGCMGFVNVTAGVRAIGYIERNPLPSGPVAFISHSGSVFSAVLRTRRHLGFTLVVSSGQELVTTAADYLDYVLGNEETRVVGLLLETLRTPERMRHALARAADLGVAVVALTVGASRTGRAMVHAHSGALAGADGTWEALFEAHGVIRVGDLDEMADTLELFAGRRAAPSGSGIATVHDSGAERALVADVAEAVGVPFAPIGEVTRQRLAALIDPGLAPCNPLDVWGGGSDTKELFEGCLRAIAEDQAVSAVALAVDFVEEYDGDESYPDAVTAAAAATDTPVVVLSNLGSAIDSAAAARVRAAGVPVLEGTRSGLLALRHLLDHARPRPAVRAPEEIDADRQERWRSRLAAGPLRGAEAFELLRQYGVSAIDSRSVDSPQEAVAAAEALGYPVVLKTDNPAIAHKSDVGGVVLGVVGPDRVAATYDDLAGRFGPAVLVAATAPPGVELALGLVADPLLGPLVVLGAGGVLVEMLADRVVRLPPLDETDALAALAMLQMAPILDGARGSERVGRADIARAVVGLSQLALELGDRLAALDVNPLRCDAQGCVAVDVLVELGTAPSG
jgi:acetate---CoA ligase (ADP-forming)